MGGILLADIGRRVLAVGQCPTLGDHPAVQVFGARAADSHDPAVSVGVPRLAGDHLLADVVGQRECCLLAAAAASHVCRDPGASIPNRRIRWPWISSVSSSMTNARPVRLAADQGQDCRYRRSVPQR